VAGLTTFVASLPPPKSDPGEHAGKAVFEAVGCVACHCERIGAVEGVYSDLLLHDLGHTLRDEALSSYGPVERVEGSAEGTEWRTPPLWGVADSAPYLHDGRAPSLHQAILLHGGESDEIRRAYEALPRSDREELLAFLRHL